LPPEVASAIRAEATTVVTRRALIDRLSGSIRSRIAGGELPPPLEAHPLRMRSPLRAAVRPLYAVISLGWPEELGASGSRLDRTILNAAGSIL
jgi:hypothetical protein